jgi:tetrahydromethanopterin S-methyltransferase subunit F
LTLCRGTTSNACFGVLVGFVLKAIMLYDQSMNEPKDELQESVDNLNRDVERHAQVAGRVARLEYGVKVDGVEFLLIGTGDGEAVNRAAAKLRAATAGISSWA